MHWQRNNNLLCTQQSCIRVAVKDRRFWKTSLTSPPRPKSPPEPIGVDVGTPVLGAEDAAVVELVVLELHGTGVISHKNYMHV